MFAIAFVILLGGHSHSPVTAVVLDAVCYVLQGASFHIAGHHRCSVLQ